jgi:hypothetical protein
MYVCTQQTPHPTRCGGGTTPASRRARSTRTASPRNALAPCGPRGRSSEARSKSPPAASCSLSVSLSFCLSVSLSLSIPPSLSPSLLPQPPTLPSPLPHPPLRVHHLTSALSQIIGSSHPLLQSHSSSQFLAPSPPRFVMAPENGKKTRGAGYRRPLSPLPTCLFLKQSPSGQYL